MIFVDLAQLLALYTADIYINVTNKWATIVLYNRPLYKCPYQRIKILFFYKLIHQTYISVI